MPARLQFIPPEQKNPISIQFSESYKRRLRAYENNYLKVIGPDIHERTQMKHWAHKSIAKPVHISTKILRVARTKLEIGLFEDEDGNIVLNNAPREGLSFLLIETIEDPKSLENGNPPGAFPLSSDTFWVGTYDRPKFQLTTDQRGNIIKSTVAGGFKCAYLEYTAEKAREILSQYEKDPTFTMLVYEGDYLPRSVPNEKEWLEGNIDDLIEGNKGDVNGKSYLTKEYGGLNRYLFF